MYGGVWEVVGKNRKDKNVRKSVKLSKVEKKKFIQNAPKVEDFLPLDQVKTLYHNLDGNKENKNPAKEKQSKTKENEEKKKKQKQLHVEKMKEVFSKKKPPKSIEEALNRIDMMETQNLLTVIKTTYPHEPLVWLESLVHFINIRINIDKEDPVFSGRPDGYPLNIVPKNLYIFLEKTIENAGPQNIQHFYDHILTRMAMEMVKGCPVIGYKIFIQILAKHDPEYNLINIQKLINMRNYYQSKKSIEMALLWSFNQGGRENLTVGLRVWHKVMFPLLEAKKYSNYVMQILNDLITWHSNDVNLQIDIYLNILENFFSGKFNIPQSKIDEGVISLKKLKIILFQNKNINYQKLFEMLLPKVIMKTPENFKNEILETLTACLIADKQCFNIWKSLYIKYLFISWLNLKYIESCWCTLQPSLNSKLLLEFLSVIQLSYEKSKKGKGKDDKYLFLCTKSSRRSILEKMEPIRSNYEL